MPAKELKRRQRTINKALGRHGVEVRADSPEWAEVQAVLSRGDRALADVLLAIPPGQLNTRLFFRTMENLGLDKEHYLGQWKAGDPLPWDIVQSGVSENYFNYELRLATEERTGLSCPPDSAGCLTCQACDSDWAFRYGANETGLSRCQGRGLASAGLAALDKAQGPETRHGPGKCHYRTDPH